jgi:hypothetical protein
VLGRQILQPLDNGSRINNVGLDLFCILYMIQAVSFICMRASRPLLDLETAIWKACTVPQSRDMFYEYSLALKNNLFTVWLLSETEIEETIP